MTDDLRHLTQSEYWAARRSALGVGSHGRLTLLGIATGGIGGVLAAAIGFSPLVLYNPLISIGGAFVMGCYLGSMCGLVAMALLHNRNYRAASWIVLGLTSFLVGIAALICTDLFQLVLFALVAFGVATFVAWYQLPKIELDAHRCRSCGYDLRGSMQIGRCPECGTEILKVQRDQRPEPRYHPFARPTRFAYGLLIAVVIAGVMLGEAWHTRRPDPFDAATWHAMPATSRHAMARDLVARDTLIGLTEEQVLKLLGPPTSMGGHKTRDNPRQLELTLIYQIGSTARAPVTRRARLQRSVPVSLEFTRLVLYFENGKVIRTKLLTAYD